MLCDNFIQTAIPVLCYKFMGPCIQRAIRNTARNPMDERGRRVVPVGTRRGVRGLREKTVSPNEECLG